MSTVSAQQGATTIGRIRRRISTEEGARQAEDQGEDIDIDDEEALRGVG
jgi:hypothetical protein